MLEKTGVEAELRGSTKTEKNVASLSYLHVLSKTTALVS